MMSSSNLAPASVVSGRSRYSKALSRISNGTLLGELSTSQTSTEPLLRANIGGIPYTFQRHKLALFPHSRLGQISLMTDTEVIRAKLCDGYVKNRKSFFFDRSPRIFDKVAQFYRIGKLHIEFVREMKYWKLKPEMENSCLECGKMIQKRLNPPVPKESKRDRLRQLRAEEELQGFSPRAKYRKLKKAVWDFMENPGMGVASLSFAAITIFFICLTVALIVLQSLPGEPFQINHCRDINPNSTTSNNITVNQDLIKLLLMPNMTYLDGVEEDKESTTEEPVIHDEQFCYNEPNEIMVYLDLVCIIWFTLDYFVRFWAAPNRWTYGVSALSIVDLLSIVPFYIEEGLSLGGIRPGAGGSNSNSIKITRIARMVRVFRVLRVLKLARYSFGMKLMAISLSRSVSELVLMCFYTLLCTLIFSTILYYIEGDEPGTLYNTIPAAAWWSVVTLLTYSDAPPVSIGGKVVTACGAIVGVLLLAFPITVVVDKFGRVYDEIREDDPNRPRDSDEED